MTDAAKSMSSARDESPALLGEVEAYRLGAQLLRELNRDLDENPEPQADLPSVVPPNAGTPNTPPMGDLGNQTMRPDTPPAAATKRAKTTLTRPLTASKIIANRPHEVHSQKRNDAAR
jgi:hypothetical protein